MEHYSATRIDAVLPFATTGMKLEGIMLSEFSQREANTLCHLYVELKKKQKQKQKTIPGTDCCLPEAVGWGGE